MAGVFGCHAALVLRRLRRVCGLVYGSSPTFAVTTATLANPGDHARNLLGVESVNVIAQDGSPHGPKCFVLWNPPLLAAAGAPAAEEPDGGGGRRAQRAKRGRSPSDAGPPPISFEHIRS